MIVNTANNATNDVKNMVKLIFQQGVVSTSLELVTRCIRT